MPGKKNATCAGSALLMCGKLARICQLLVWYAGLGLPDIVC
jgi:hypothetical protein